jgi:hypothetical protein
MKPNTRAAKRGWCPGGDSRAEEHGVHRDDLSCVRSEQVVRVEVDEGQDCERHEPGDPRDSVGHFGAHPGDHTVLLKLSGHTHQHCEEDQGLPSPVSVTMFFQLSTLAASRIATPVNATDVALMFSSEPLHHRTRSRTNVPAMTISERVIEPILLSRSRACAGASGVRVTEGG